jgi:putative RNA 2'-phosphotransferase
VDEVVRRSKQLSKLLRHTAGERGLAMTPDGWADVADVCALLKIDRTTLLRAVEHNDKSRLELDGDRIRAGQGHSREGMPVTLEALEQSWRRVEPAELLWHGTSVAAVEGIARTGLEPGRRTHVHLAPAADSHVGRRSAVDLLLGIDPAQLRDHGIAVFEAPNGVLLARRVPTGCFSRVDSASRAGQRALTGARRALLR